MTTHFFETLDAARSTLAAAETTDFTISDQPYMWDGDVLQIAEPHLIAYVVRGQIRAIRREDANNHQLAFIEGDSPLRNAAVELFRGHEAARRAMSVHGRINVVVARIASAIGSRAEIRPAGWGSRDGLLIDGTPADTLVIREDRTSYNSFGRRGATGKISVTVGDYGNKTRFAERKDGGHNYAEIARLLLIEHERFKAQRAAEARRRANQATLTEETKATFGNLGFYSSASSDPAKPVNVRFTINSNLTPDQVRALAALLAELGVK